VPQRVAALDVGSNTVHLLVADPLPDGRVHEVCRVVRMPRIGASVNATGRIGEAKIREVAGMVREAVGIARECGAEVVLLGATEAVRKAADREAALGAFSEAAGVPCVLIPGDAEARLSFRGAVSMAAPDGVALVCDVGGGSTELALGTRQRIEALASLPIGSGAATDRWLHDDPSTEEQRRACFAGVLDVLRNGAPSGHPDHALTTGGTAASLPRLLDRDVESTLDAADMSRCREILASMPSADVARRHSLDPARARVLAGGVEIIDAIRFIYALDRVRVTIHGLRTGMILTYLEKGDRWPEGLTRDRA
jgi:exopolyphosphatase / guanosine-5'-triphosphate,3'-diphosphate pyrophosphatase